MYYFYSARSCVWSGLMTDSVTVFFSDVMLLFKINLTRNSCFCSVC